MGRTTKAAVVQRRRLISWRAKLTAREVRRIRRLYERGWSQGRILVELSLPISQSAMSMLLRGLTYRQVV